MVMFKTKWYFSTLQSSSRNKRYRRDWKQCCAKVKTKYREVKNNNGNTGKGRQTCKFYSKLDVILGHRPAALL